MLGPSKIHGIGLFAVRPIKRGAVVWRFNAAIDIRIATGALHRLARPARSQIASYVYLDNRTGELILCGDDARFFNHATDPNVDDDIHDPYQCIAARDIDAGEELTQDYFSFDVLAWKKLSGHQRSSDRKCGSKSRPARTAQKGARPSVN